MRLKSINVYSDYLGSPDKTKERTVQLRGDSDFLDYTFVNNIKYVDNSYLKQLNIKCSEVLKEISIISELEPGYPEIGIPFDSFVYNNMDAHGKKLFWIKTIEDVFDLLMPKLNCEDTEILRYIKLLHEEKSNLSR